MSDLKKQKEELSQKLNIANNAIKSLQIHAKRSKQYKSDNTRKDKVVANKNLYENRMCNQWDNWRAYGPELLL